MLINYLLHDLLKFWFLFFYSCYCKVALQMVAIVSKILSCFWYFSADTATACPSNNWTSWFNRDDPSGPCDCETLTELRNENPGQICDFPISFEARLENCQVPYDPSLPNVIADLELGFECRNENGWICMDYEVRYCCPWTSLDQFLDGVSKPLGVFNDKPGGFQPYIFL